MKKPNPLSDTTATAYDLKQMVREFRDARGWGSYDSPGSWAKDIIVEAGELLEHFIWDEDAYSKDKDVAREVRYELVDILYGILAMAITLNIDITTTLKEKLKLLEKKYPAKEYLKMKREADSDTYLAWHRKKKKDFKAK